MARELLRVVQGKAHGAELALTDAVTLGRGSPDSAVLRDDPELSRSHARIIREPSGHLVIEDLGSTNGTLLNGWRIPSPQLLSPGDHIQVGTTLLELVAGDTSHGRPAPIVSGVHGHEELRPAASASALYVTGVEKSYGDLSVLRGVDLEVQPGEIVGLLGPNGAGKTTLVSIIAGLRSADAGEVLVNGVDALADPRQARRHLGLAPQDLGLYPTMTVERNLAFFGELNGLSGKLLRDRVGEVAEALSLTPILGQRAGSLSGGQQRRLHTGMAMLHRPPLLMLDEPTVGADIRTRQEILDAVRALAAEGRAICYSTHYLPEIEELGASVAILDEGQIVARGSIAELVRNYGTSAVELRFSGPAPSIDFPGEVTVEGTTLRVKTEAPDEAAAALLQRLGADVDRLVSIEVLRPDLDGVYLALTNKRYSNVQPLPNVPDQGFAPVAPGELPSFPAVS